MLRRAGLTLILLLGVVVNLGGRMRMRLMKLFAVFWSWLVAIVSAVASYVAIISVAIIPLTVITMARSRSHRWGAGEDQAVPACILMVDRFRGRLIEIEGVSGTVAMWGRLVIRGRLVVILRTVMSLWWMGMMIIGRRWWRMIFITIPHLWNLYWTFFYLNVDLLHLAASTPVLLLPAARVHRFDISKVVEWLLESRNDGLVFQVLQFYCGLTNVRT